MREQILKISDVYVDNEIYPRESYSKATVNQYKKDMKFGAVFPNIRVAKFKNKYYLIDGLHRLKSKDELGEDFIKADIQENLRSKLDIYLASIRANVSHGKSLSTKDKLKVAKQLKKFKVEVDSISKLLHINEKDLEKIGLGNIADIQRLKVTNQSFTSILKDKRKIVHTKSIPNSKKVDEEIVEKPIEIMSDEDEQYAQLNAFLWWLKNTEIIHNKLNRQKLVLIEKQAKRELANMRK